MASRSSVSMLPEDVRDELNRRLVESNFSGYEGLARWLREQGFEISKSAIHRHGSALEADFEEAMADVRRTRALARAVKNDGDEGEVLAATSGILQEQLLRISIALRTADSDPAEAAKSISMVARAHSDVGRLQVALSKWQEELKAKCQAAADACEQAARRGGLTPDTVEVIRREILGITA
ncbi:MAG: phage protein Gp27 family protein [Candidatus Accumulibacter phosphatis]